MGKKQKTILRQVNNGKDMDLLQNKEFLNNFQMSLLLALLERDLITRYQFQQCVEEILREGGE